MNEKNTIIEEQTNKKKKLNFLKVHWKKIIIIGIAITAIIGIIIGIISLLNSIKADKIQKQIDGMIFEYYEEGSSYPVDTWTDFYYWEAERYIFDEETFTSTTWHVINNQPNEILYDENENDTNIKITLSGKILLNNYTEIIIENDKITGLNTGTKFIPVVEKSNIDNILEEKNVYEEFDTISEIYRYKWTPNKNSNTTNNDKNSYNLPTTDMLIENFKKSFTLSNIKQEAGNVTFKVSTGETIYGFTYNSGKVKTFQVFVSGSSMDSLLDANYHFYPMCHFLSGIKGKTVTVDNIVEILMSEEPTATKGSVSNTLEWNVRKEGILYELVLTEYSTGNYCTMDLYARIN